MNDLDLFMKVTGQFEWLVTEIAQKGFMNHKVWTDFKLLVTLTYQCQPMA